MKWLQLDADFFTNPAMRAVKGKYGSQGVHVILDIWSKVAARIEKTNASCRLLEGLDLVAADTQTPPDRVSAIVQFAFDQVYEVINSFPYPLLDIDTERVIGCNLLIYKLDNATSDSPYIKSLKSERRQFEHLGGFSRSTSKGLPKHFQETSKQLPLQTDLQTDRLTDSPGAGGLATVVGDPTQFHDLYYTHIKKAHKGLEDINCWTCRDFKDLPVDKAATA